MQDQNQPTTFTPNAPIVGGVEPPAAGSATPDWQQGLVPGAEQSAPGVTPPQFQQPDPYMQTVPADAEIPEQSQAFADIDQQPMVAPLPAGPAFMNPDPVPAQQLPAQDFAPAGVAEKNYVVAFILASFFGFFAFDRFYLKKYITGVLKLLTFGGFGIWVAIDIYKIGTGTARTKDGQQLADSDKYVHIGKPVARAVIVYVILVIIFSALFGIFSASLTSVQQESSTVDSGFSESIPAEGFVDTTSESAIE